MRTPEFLRHTLIGLQFAYALQKGGLSNEHWKVNACGRAVRRNSSADSRARHRRRRRARRSGDVGRRADTVAVPVLFHGDSTSAGRRMHYRRASGLADAAFRLSGGGRGGVHMRLAGRQSGRSQADRDVRGRRPHEPRTMPAARLAVHGVFACVRAGRVGEHVAALRLGTAYIKLAGDASGKSDSQASRRR